MEGIMERHQFIFVLQDAHIAQWRYENDKLEIRTSRGLESVEYNPEQYWQNWADENYFTPSEDVLDAFFLLDNPDAINQMPEWVFNGNGFSQLPLKTIKDLAHEKYFSNVNLVVAMAGDLMLGDKTKSQLCRLFLRPTLQLPILSSMQMLLLQNRFVIWMQKSEDEFQFKRSVKFQPGHLAGQIELFMDELSKVFRLKDNKSLSISLIENSLEELNKTAIACLGDALHDTISITKILQKYMKHLDNDKSLDIMKYGVNFDGWNWISVDSTLKKNNFSLLGYTIDISDFFKFYNSSFK